MASVRRLLNRRPSRIRWRGHTFPARPLRRRQRSARHRSADFQRRPRYFVWIARAPLFAGRVVRALVLKPEFTQPRSQLAIGYEPNLPGPAAPSAANRAESAVEVGCMVSAAPQHGACRRRSSQVILTPSTARSACRSRHRRLHAHDIRLACHGLDKRPTTTSSSAWCRKDLFPLSAVVQAMHRDAADGAGIWNISARSSSAGSR